MDRKTRNTSFKVYDILKPNNIYKSRPITSILYYPIIVVIRV